MPTTLEILPGGLWPAAPRFPSGGDCEATAAAVGANGDDAVGAAPGRCDQCVNSARALVPAPVVTSSVRCVLCGAIVIFGRTPADAAPAWYVITAS